MNDMISINNKMLEQFRYSDDILSDASVIIEAAQDTAFRAVNVALLQRNWLLGKRIAEEELSGNRQEDYGLEIIKNLSKQLNKNTVKALPKRTYIIFTAFTRSIRTFSRQRLENLCRC